MQFKKRTFLLNMFCPKMKNNKKSFFHIFIFRSFFAHTLGEKKNYEKLHHKLNGAIIFHII